MAVGTRESAVSGKARVVIQSKTQRHFLCVDRQCLGDRLNRLITVFRGSLVTGVVTRALLRYPAKQGLALLLIHLPRPVQGDIPCRRHGLMLHYPFNLVQIAL
ncbi:hypothetical protein D3C71_1417910 [compost metagenome]